MSYYLFKYGYTALFYGLLSACAAMALVAPTLIASFVLLGAFS